MVDVPLNQTKQNQTKESIIRIYHWNTTKYAIWLTDFNGMLTGLGLVYVL